MMLAVMMLRNQLVSSLAANTQPVYSAKKGAVFIPVPPQAIG